MFTIPVNSPDIVTYPCDANASGAETAVYSVQTWQGPIVLCAHHARQHGPAILSAGFAMAKLRGSAR